MSFPFLDRLPLKSRLAARRTVGLFKNELKRGLQASHYLHKPAEKASLSDPSDMLGKRMLDARASGQWDEKQLLDNLTVAFVAGQENPQLAMISSLYLLAKHPVSPGCGAQARAVLRRRVLVLTGVCSACRRRKRLCAKKSFPRVPSLQQIWPKRTCRISPPSSTSACGYSLPLAN